MKATSVKQLIHGTAILCVALLSGCATIRNGGAPVPAFNLDNDIKALEANFGPSASISKFYETSGDKKDARDEFIDGRLALYNIRYIQFIRDLGVDKQHLDAATDIFLLGVGLAGTLTGGVMAKTNLAALATLTTGSKISIDKHFYFEKTVPALVATMNAQRKAILIRIIEGRKLSVDGYPLAQALTDLYDYEQAGTLIGAINTIQADAGIKGADRDKKIRNLQTATARQIADMRSFNPAVAALVNDSTKLAEVNGVLKAIGAQKSDFKIFPDAAEALENAFRDASPGDVEKWRSALGFLIP